MRLLLAEDDSVLGDALSKSLRQSGYAVDWARNGQEADLALTDQVYSLAILDLGLPKMDGFEVLRRLRQRRSKLPVIILTAREALEDRVKGLDLGADDYLAKPFELPELEARLRALIRRGSEVASPEIVVGQMRFNPAERVLRIHDQPLELSARELGVLEMLLLKAGQAVAKEALVEHLCSWDDEMGDNAIEVYVHRLRKKLEPEGIHIRTVRGLGYMLDKPAETLS
jgi:two-component system OmpR family response regulator